MLNSSTTIQVDNIQSDPNSILSPISIPHYIWHANFYGNTDFPVHTDCLLDNGAHLVLIRPETVANLGLHIRKLSKPQQASVAINSHPQTFLLYD